MVLNTYQRRAQIIELLKTRGKVSGTELVKLYDVSNNTIKNDMWHIGRQIPITVDYGRYGGYRYLGERKVELTEKEVAILKVVLEKYADEISETMYNTLMEKFKVMDR